MPPVPSDEYLARLRHALRMAIKAEMGRQDITPNALAGLLGQNPQYVNQRILSPSRRTGNFVEINVADLYSIAGALDVEPAALMKEARAAAGAGNRADAPTGAAGRDEVAERRQAKRSVPASRVAKNVAPKGRKRTGEDAGAPEE